MSTNVIALSHYSNCPFTISFLKKSSWCPCPLKKSYWEFYDSFKSTCVLVIPTVSTGIHLWKIFTIHLMNLCVVILTISTYIFHLRNILIYVQDLLVFHCKTIFIHAYIDESLTRLPTLPTPSPRGLLSTVTWHWSAGRVWDWRYRAKASLSVFTWKEWGVAELGAVMAAYLSVNNVACKSVRV